MVGRLAFRFMSQTPRFASAEGTRAVIDGSAAAPSAGLDAERKREEGHVSSPRAIGARGRARLTARGGKACRSGGTKLRSTAGVAARRASMWLKTLSELRGCTNSEGVLVLGCAGV